MKKQPVGSGPWQFESISDNTWPCSNKNYNGAIRYRTISSTRRPYDPTAFVWPLSRTGTTLLWKWFLCWDQLKGAGCTVDAVQALRPFCNVHPARPLGTTLRFARHAHLIQTRCQTHSLVKIATITLPSFAIITRQSTVYAHDVDKAKKLISESGITLVMLFFAPPMKRRTKTN